MGLKRPRFNSPGSPASRFSVLLLALEAVLMEKHRASAASRSCRKPRSCFHLLSPHCGLRFGEAGCSTHRLEPVMLPALCCAGRWGSARTPSHQVFATPSTHLPLVHISSLACTFPEGTRLAQGRIRTPLTLALTHSPSATGAWEQRGAAGMGD